MRNKSILITIFLLLFFVAACSNFKKVNDEQILEDLKNNSFIIEYSNQIVSFEVTSRNQENDKQTEIVYSTVVFDSEYANIIAYYESICKKGEEGWYIIDSKLIDYKVDKIYEPNISELTSIVSKYAEKELRKQSLNLNVIKHEAVSINHANSQAEIIFNVDYDDKYVNQTGTIKVFASFELAKGWSVDSIEYSIKRNWKLENKKFKLTYLDSGNSEGNLLNKVFYFTGTFNESYSNQSRNRTNNLTLHFEDKIILKTKVNFYDHHDDIYFHFDLVVTYFIPKYDQSTWMSFNAVYDYEKQEFNFFTYFDEVIVDPID